MKFIFTLALSLLLAFAGISFAAPDTRGLGVYVKETGQPTGEVKLYNKTWAVFIGIDRYQEQGIPRLKNAVNDARGVKKVLEQRYRFDNYRELYDEKATQKNIQELFQDELAEKVGEDDAVFVFWAGHGTQQENSRFGEIGYLVPHDGSWNRHSRNISMDTLKNTISKSLKARHVFYVMDACYGGLMADTRNIPKENQRTLKAMQQIAKYDVRQILTAGSKNETVLDGINGHSVFTANLIEALESRDDYLLASEIAGIIKRNVVIEAQKQDHKQTPQFAPLYGQGDFVFVASNDYRLAEQQAKIDKDKQGLERQKADNEKLKKQIAEDEAMMAAAARAGDERKRQAAELELKKKQALQKIEEARQKEREDQLRRDEQAAAGLKQREAERQRIQEEARLQQAKVQESAQRQAREQAQLEQEQQKQKAEEEKRNAELRRQGEEKRKKALEAFTATSSIEAAVEDIRKADAEIAGINRDFDAELARQKAAADSRLNQKKTRLKADYDKRMLEMKNQPTVSVSRPVIAPRDMEFEKESEYRARVQKAEDDYNRRLAEAQSVGGTARQAESGLYTTGIQKAEAEYRSEIADIEQRISTSRAEAIKPFRERIATIAAKEYPVSPQSLKLTIGMYNPDTEKFPVSITSTAVNLSVEGTLSLPRDQAKQFKQWYTTGLVRPEATMKTGSSKPIRIAMINEGVKSDADNYLLEYFGGEFVTVSEKKKRTELEPQMVNVPAGCFNPDSTQVCLDAFRIGKYEVTQGQYKRIMGSNPSKFSSCGDDCPVENVSWNDIQQFLQKLNSQTGRTGQTSRMYRLPTEAEWHYACTSGGGNEEYCGGNDVDAVAWFDKNSGSTTHKVGIKKPNGLGIYDMSGNVWEWVSDWYGDNYPTHALDAMKRGGLPWVSDWYGDNYPTASRSPKGSSIGKQKVLRGGSWTSNDRNTRAAFRTRNSPDNGGSSDGFRLAVSED